MSNDFSKKTTSQLAVLGANVAGKLAGQTNPYGVSAPTVAALTAINTALPLAINAQLTARAAEKAATEQKHVKRATMIGVLSDVATAVYANPAVTDEMLFALGFEPRPTGRSQPKAPVAPTGLMLSPRMDGTVKLTWSRNGGAYRTVYRIETSADGVTWSFLDTTTCASYVATGFAPGTSAWFRVVASNRQGRSLPCPCASIYTPVGERVELKVA